LSRQCKTLLLIHDAIVGFNMGFGSYDESEQQNGSTDEEDDGEAVNVHENEYEGDIEFETEASTEDLVAKLGDMTDDDSDQS
jgi:hypothetical protein